MTLSLPSITPLELKALIESKEPFTLLDVREDEEVELASIPSALHIPMKKISTHVQELNPASLIVVMCHSGHRSAQVCSFLAQMGFETVNLTGGINAWSKYIDPAVPVY